jgi:hypothetical protein
MTAISPKMSRKQAVYLWNTLSPEQKAQFNKMYSMLNKGELLMKEINVDDNEQIQNIVLEPKEKRSAPVEPYAKHFKQAILDD